MGHFLDRPKPITLIDIRRRAGLEAETSVILPHTVHDLLEHFDCVKNFHPDKFRYDFLQILPSDELREKEFTQEAFTWPPAPLRGANPRDDEELVGRAMGLIKVRLVICFNC